MSMWRQYSMVCSVCMCFVDWQSDKLQLQLNRRQRPHVQRPVYHVSLLVILPNEWRRQCSKGVRSFRGQKILQPGHPDALFSQNKLTNFLFSVHTIIEAKQYAVLGRAEPGLEPGRWYFEPGRALVYVCMYVRKFISGAP